MQRDFLDDGPGCKMAVALIMESDHKSRMVKFMRTDEKKKKQGAQEERNVGKILIKTLIDCNNKIFG